MSAAMSSAMKMVLSGRSMSAVRPWPCRSSDDDLVVVRKRGQERTEHLARPEPAVEQDQRLAPTPWIS